MCGPCESFPGISPRVGTRLPHPIALDSVFREAENPLSTAGHHTVIFDRPTAHKTLTANNLHILPTDGWPQFKPTLRAEKQHTKPTLKTSSRTRPTDGWPQFAPSSPSPSSTGEGACPPVADCERPLPGYSRRATTANAVTEGRPVPRQSLCERVRLRPALTHGSRMKGRKNTVKSSSEKRLFWQKNSTQIQR